MRVKDKVAIITGAASGIGRVTPQMMVKEGVKEEQTAHIFTPRFRGSLTLPRLHHKHRASGSPSGGSFTKITPEPSLVVATLKTGMKGLLY